MLTSEGNGVEGSALEEVHKVGDQLLPGEITGTLRLAEGTVLEARQALVLHTERYIR